jgi:hypothetical protein
MSFSVGKCKVIHLGRKKMDWNYVIRQQRLEVVSDRGAGSVGDPEG